MITEPEDLVARFRALLAHAGVPGTRGIRHELQSAPHVPHALPLGEAAVYVFSLSKAYGDTCPAGAHRVLKVGRAGANSSARFQSQHYNPRSALSTLAGSLLRHRDQWERLGIAELNEAGVRLWITANTDRDNFFVKASDADLLPLLERYLIGQLLPVFEGG